MTTLLGVGKRFGHSCCRRRGPCDNESVSTAGVPAIDNVSSALAATWYVVAAHFPFVHGVDEAAEVHDKGVTRDEWEMGTVFETWYREKGRIERQLLGKVGNASLTVKLRLDFTETGTCIAILFCCTPERRGQTRVYKLLTHSGLGDAPTGVARFVDEEDRILREDLAILQRYDHEELFLDRSVELHASADRLSLAWRSVMADLVAERAPVPTGADEFDLAGLAR